MTDGNRKRACYGAALLFVALLAGCAATEPRARLVNQSGYSDSFRQGYTEGCESAGGRSQRRNEGRYKTEADYMMGWNDGFSACRKGR
jgi:hypothetical protein